MKTNTFGAVGAALALGLSLGAPTRAAQVDATEYQALLAEAQKNGAARVMAVLDVTVTLDDMHARGATIEQVVPQKAAALLAELGGEAWSTGFWNNGLGQVGVYLTPAGLKYLAASGNARWFMRDPTDKQRWRVSDIDGRVSAIEKRIDGTGSADVVVTMNLASLDFDLARDRTVRHRPVDEAEAGQARQRLLGKLTPRHVPEIAAVRGRPMAGATVHLRVTREGLQFLKEHADVRSMRLADFVDARPSTFDPEALERARRTGKAEVLIALRSNDPYNPGSGHMHDQAWKNQGNANRRVFSEILANKSDGVTGRVDHSEFGAMSAHLSYAALSRLYEEADPRILSVRLNKPAGEATLSNSASTSTSTSIIKMPNAWANGYTAAGQNIVIFDTGVRKSHVFFQMNGATKVWYELCGGTNDYPFASVCPAADAAGDSPVNHPGAGEPVMSACAPTPVPAKNPCSHGTHVAGIAAGRDMSLASYKGVARDAKLISAHVYSYDVTKAQPPKPYDADVLLGLAYLANNTVGDNYTANLSLGNNLRNPGDCAGGPYQNVVAQLHSRGIPVVVSTGNNQFTTGISHPACTPLTIKATGTENQGSGTTIHYQSNVGNPANYSGAFLAAPGWNIYSSIADNNTSAGSNGGTSMAAPHVAGFYATVKAANPPGTPISSITAWIYGTGSFPISYAGYTFRAIRAP